MFTFDSQHRIHLMMLLQLLCGIVALGNASKCTEDYPYVYYNGDYCCASDTEKVYTPQGELCDGGSIGFDSLCCLGDAHQECSDSPCSDYSGESYEIREPPSTFNWERVDGNMKLVALGKLGVWGINSANHLYYLDGNTWTKIPGEYKDVAVGDQFIWVIKPNGNIARSRSPRKGWESVDGAKTQIDATDDGFVWGVNSILRIWYIDGNGEQDVRNPTWNSVEGRKKQISAGPAGIWGIAGDNGVYYREGTYGNNRWSGFEWTHFPGIKLKWVAVGDDIVFGITPNDEVYYRSGIDVAHQEGTGWVKMNGSLTQIDVYRNIVMGTNSANEVFKVIM